MSQEKVNRYKEEKANRKEILRRERRNSLIRKIVFAVLAVALVAWIGYSAHYTHMQNRDREMVVVNFDGITNYLESLTAEELELEPDADGEPDAESETGAEGEPEAENELDAEPDAE